MTDDTPMSDTLDALERLQQAQAAKEVELGGVTYEIFTVRQEIEGHALYPETDARRQEVEGHRRRLETLVRRETALSDELRGIYDRVTELRERVATASHGP